MLCLAVSSLALLRPASAPTSQRGVIRSGQQTSGDAVGGIAQLGGVAVGLLGSSAMTAPLPALAEMVANPYAKEAVVAAEPGGGFLVS